MYDVITAILQAVGIGAILLALYLTYALCMRLISKI